MCFPEKLCILRCSKPEGMLKRKIGIYDECISGPLIFVIGGMHGNEHSGIRAIELLIKMLEVEHITKPDFRFKGRLVGFVGNLQAIKSGTRFIDRDLNRIWDSDRITELMNNHSKPAFQEEFEMLALLKAMSHEVKKYSTDKILIIDLHTTSAKGGIFVVPSKKQESLEFAFSIKAPVVDGLLDGISNPAQNYFDSNPWGVPVWSVSFESGMHQDPESVYVAIAALVNILKSIGSVEPEDVESRHDHLLEYKSKGQPKLSHLLHIHKIEPGDNFIMRPGFENFQFVKKDTILARDRKGEIKCPEDAYLLMPLYQTKGNDGFFLVKGDENYGLL
jgi:succinylglutamate desuccinylase